MEYPFLDLVRQHLKDKNDPDKTLKWLADEIGRSDRWFYHIKKMEDVSLGDLGKISQALDWNVISDYDNWRLQNREEPMFMLSEPAVEYHRAPKPNKVSVNIKISATQEIAEINLGKMFRALRVAADSLGFEIEG